MSLTSLPRSNDVITAVTLLLVSIFLIVVGTRLRRSS